MKYTKIRNIPLDVCTAEQKIAYNLAFRAHISFQDKFNTLKAEQKFETVISEFISDIIRFEIKEYSQNYTIGNIDAIFSALNAGLRNYFEKPFIASNYDDIGKAFPANYLGGCKN